MSKGLREVGSDAGKGLKQLGKDADKGIAKVGKQTFTSATLLEKGVYIRLTRPHVRQVCLVLYQALLAPSARNA